MSVPPPIGILDEHPTWSSRLTAELAARGAAFERIDPSAHGFRPSERDPRHSVIVNRVSPSSHTRGHGAALFYAHAFLAYVEELGIPVVNPAAAYRAETSKAYQALLFERLGLRYPRTAVVNDVAWLPKVAEGFRYPVVVKPNIGGSGAGIVRFETAEELDDVARGGSLRFGPDGVALVQEFLEPADGGIVRVEVLGGEYLYAIKIYRDLAAGFNLCPADICRTEPAAAPPVAPTEPLGYCPADAPRLALRVEAHQPPRSVIDSVLALTHEARIDVGGVEYLVDRADGQAYFYDVNATSNFVADAPAVVGFDPTVRFADYIQAVAAGRPPVSARPGARRAAA
jgi:hypothetical protein